MPPKIVTYIDYGYVAHDLLVAYFDEGEHSPVTGVYYQSHAKELMLKGNVHAAMKVVFGVKHVSAMERNEIKPRATFSDDKVNGSDKTFMEMPGSFYVIDEPIPERLISISKGEVMHSTVKDMVASDKQAKELNVPVGAHILTTNIESDIAAELASEKAEFDAKILSVRRSASGGIQFQAAVWSNEPPAAEPEKPVSAEDQAMSYLASKGFSPEDAKKHIESFGAQRILAKASQEEADKEKSLDSELDSLISQKKEPAASTVQ